jgi:Asp-tRNA(Asn)/Glu-tRNA(Gln) amidotransferase A subunit family amidase
MVPHLTIAEASRLIAAKQLSPVELTEACLARIRALDPTLHAFIRVTEDRALAEARAAEGRAMAGTRLGPLDGIPIGHKDIYATAGIATTAHSKLLENNVPDTDATVVRRWAEAGTVLLGKLATHEFAFGGPSFDLPWPPARNAWNPAHFTAGSSSGTGAAVASGMVLGGTGSDTGGSIRGPAALCGLAGIKPTYGLASRVGVQPLAFTLDHTGPLAWTAEDCALLLAAMAGHDPADPASANRPAPDLVTGLDAGVKGLRIGVVRHFFETDHPVSPGVRQGIEAAERVFAGLGATVRDVTLPPMLDFQACGWVILIIEAFAVHEPWMKTRLNDYGEMFRDRVALGGLLRASDYVQAVRRRRILTQQVAAVMEDVDLLLTAPAPAEAPEITAVTKWSTLEKPSFTIPFNVTGQPAMSVCTGFGAGGLPVSMQLVGRPFEDALVLRAAHAFERATGWRKARPALAA